MNAPVVDARLIVGSAIFQTVAQERDRLTAREEHLAATLRNLQEDHVPTEHLECSCGAPSWPCPVRDLIDDALDWQPPTGTAVPDPWSKS